MSDAKAPTPEEDRGEPPDMYAPATGAPTYDLVTTETGYCCMEKAVDGDWVDADDYRTLAHERDATRAEVEQLRAERDRLLKLARAVSAAEPEMEVNSGRKICLCGAGEAPGHEHEIRHYAHCVIVMARNIIATTTKGDTDDGETQGD